MPLQNNIGSQILTLSISFFLDEKRNKKIKNERQPHYYQRMQWYISNTILIHYFPQYKRL